MRSRGFTLIEAIVSVGGFAFAFTSIAGVFIAVQQLNRKSASLQALQQNARYISEDLTKIIRNGQVDYARYGGAISQPQTVNLYLLDRDNTPVRLYRAGDNLVMEKTVGAQILTTNFTGTEARVLNFAAYVWPATNPFGGGNGTQQPTVTVFVELESNINPRDRTRMPLQVTVATRQYPE